MNIPKNFHTQLKVQFIYCPRQTGDKKRKKKRKERRKEWFARLAKRTIKKKNGKIRRNKIVFVREHSEKLINLRFQQKVNIYFNNNLNKLRKLKAYFWIKEEIRKRNTTQLQNVSYKSRIVSAKIKKNGKNCSNFSSFINDLKKNQKETFGNLVFCDVIFFTFFVVYLLLYICWLSV